MSRGGDLVSWLTVSTSSRCRILLVRVPTGAAAAVAMECRFCEVPTRKNSRDCARRSCVPILWIPLDGEALGLLAWRLGRCELALWSRRSRMVSMFASGLEGGPAPAVLVAAVVEEE